MTTETVAEFIDRHIRMSGKPLSQIAEECGFKKANFLSMIRHGRSNLPIHRVLPMAKALNVPERTLAEMVLKECVPDTWMLVAACFVNSGATSASTP